MKNPRPDSSGLDIGRIGRIADVAYYLGQTKVCEACEPCRLRGRLAVLGLTMPSVMGLLADYTVEATELFRKLVDCEEEHEGAGS